MGLKFTNFARAKLATPPSGTSGLSFTVEAGKGALFPTLGAGDYFYGVLKNATKINNEIVKIEARSTDAFTIATGGRGADGTTAQTWTTNDYFELAMTRASLLEVFNAAVVAIGALTPAANKFPYFTSATAGALTDLSAFARTVLDDADAATARGTLGAAATFDTNYLCPVATLLPFAGTSIPTGWLLCYGQEVSRATYATLFAAVGTQYGVGDGSTTFNLPDLRGRAVFGKDDMGGSAASRVTTAESGIDGTSLGAVGGDQRLHAHNHSVTDPGHSHSQDIYDNAGAGASIQRAFASSGTTIAIASATTGISIGTSGAGSSQNMPPAMMISYIIKT